MCLTGGSKRSLVTGSQCSKLCNWIIRQSVLIYQYSWRKHPYLPTPTQSQGTPFFNIRVKQFGFFHNGEKGCYILFWVCFLPHECHQFVFLSLGVYRNPVQICPFPMKEIRDNNQTVQFLGKECCSFLCLWVKPEYVVDKYYTSLGRSIAKHICRANPLALWNEACRPQANWNTYTGLPQLPGLFGLQVWQLAVRWEVYCSMLGLPLGKVRGRQFVMTTAGRTIV